MKRFTIILSLFLISSLAVAQTNASLQGRTVLGSLPRPSNTDKNSGVVVVKIWVDQYGTVQKAVAGAEGTTVTDNELWDAARKAALGAHFNMSADAPALQEGTIAFSFNTDKDRYPLQLDSLFLRDGSIVAASISRISSESVEYIYPGESAVNVLSTEDLLRIRMGSGRLINYGANSRTNRSVSDQTDSTYPDTFDLKIGNYTMKLILIKGGVFNMGYDGRHSIRYGSEPIHKVELSSYYISSDYVSRGLREFLRNGDGSGRLGGPAQLYWKDANNVVSSIAEHCNLNLRLPTEAEWEFAAISPFKKVLFSTEGNLELCYDYLADYVGDIHTSVLDPIGPSSGRRHVIRSFYNDSTLFARELWGNNAGYFRIAIKAKDLFPEL